MLAELKRPDKSSKLLTNYYCEVCETQFCLIDKNIVCPTCNSKDLQEIVIIYKDDDPSMSEYFSINDLRAGD